MTKENTAIVIRPFVHESQQSPVSPICIRLEILQSTPVAHRLNWCEVQAKACATEPVDIHVRFAMARKAVREIDIRWEKVPKGDSHKDS